MPNHLLGYWRRFLHLFFEHVPNLTLYEWEDDDHANCKEDELLKNLRAKQYYIRKLNMR